MSEIQICHNLHVFLQNVNFQNFRVNKKMFFPGLTECTRVPVCWEYGNSKFKSNKPLQIMDSRKYEDIVGVFFFQNLWNSENHPHTVLPSNKAELKVNSWRVRIFEVYSASLFCSEPFDTLPINVSITDQESGMPTMCLQSLCRLNHLSTLFKSTFGKTWGQNNLP